MVELLVQIGSSLLAKNLWSFTRFIQYPQTDLYQFFALVNGISKRNEKKIFHKKIFLYVRPVVCTYSLKLAKVTCSFFVIILVDVVFFRYSPI